MNTTNRTFGILAVLVLALVLLALPAKAGTITIQNTTKVVVTVHVASTGYYDQVTVGRLQTVTIFVPVQSEPQAISLWNLTSSVEYGGVTFYDTRLNALLTVGPPFTGFPAQINYTFGYFMLSAPSPEPFEAAPEASAD
jgi:hypothetical protein